MSAKKENPKEKDIEEKPSEATAEKTADKKAQDKKAKKEDRKTAEKTEEIPEVTAEAVAEPAENSQDKYLRLMAEYDNFRKRSQREREALYADIKADTVMKFLPVYDNLVRALEQSTQDEAYRKGVEMIMTQFVETLTKLGVTQIKSAGEKFDPNLHNAVMHVEDGEKGENEIVEVFQQGFMLGDKVIRFAMVKVAN